MKITITFFLFSLVLWAKAITLEDIRSKPACRARDFLIWEFLSQKITKQEAKQAWKLVVNKSNYKIKKRYFKYVPPKKNNCIKQPIMQIKDPKCLKRAFSLYKTYHLSKQDRLKLITSNLLSKYQKTMLLIQNEPYDIKRYMLYDTDMVTKYLLSVPKKDFKKYLDNQITKEFINFLADSKYFGAFVRYVIQRPYPNTKRKLLKTPFLPSLSSQTFFYLTLNAIELDELTQAKMFLHQSLLYSKNSYEQERGFFWLYLLTNQKVFLETLLDSSSINIYTLFAHEKLGYDIDNYSANLSTNNKCSPYDLKDPFVWNKLYKRIRNTPKDQLESLAKEFSYVDLLPLKRLVLEKAKNYKFHYYITPYETILKDTPKEDRILIYSLMRQESAYIPSALSRSFALGLMQLMPFLVDHLAKQQKENIDSYFLLLEPKKNLQYAQRHLKWLHRVFPDNPLFLAYAYNGGYGFFRKYKKQYDFSSNKYDPFFSMEMMQNNETREYGKKVLANYTIYNKVYNSSFSIIDFFERLRHSQKNQVD